MEREEIDKSAYGSRFSKQDKNPRKVVFKCDPVLTAARRAVEVSLEERKLSKEIGSSYEDY